MEVRCGSCNKLFRVTDDKITGIGIKFVCTRCGEPVKITRESFEQYKLSKAASPALAVAEVAPAVAVSGTAMSEGAQLTAAIAASPASLDPTATPPVEPSLEEQLPSIFNEPSSLPTPAPASASSPVPPKPEPMSKPVIESKTELKTAPSPTQSEAVKTKRPEVAKPASVPKPEPVSTAASAAPKPKPEPIGAASPAAAKPAPVPKPAPAIQAASATPRPAPMPKPGPVSTAAPAAAKSAPVPPSSTPAREAGQRAALAPIEPVASSGAGKKFLVGIVVLLVIVGGVIFGVRWYLGKASQSVSEVVKTVTTPDGLQIMSVTGVMDPVNGDLVVSGAVENTTDKPRPAWFVVVDVYDGQGAVLTKAKLLSGKQLYTKQDYEVLIKRGMNVQELKQKSLQEQGVVIQPKGTVNFDVRILEPPIGVASFNASLQPFDPVQLFKEIAEEQKQQ